MTAQEKAYFNRFGADEFRKRFAKKNLSSIWTVDDAKPIVDIKEQRAIADRLSNEHRYMELAEKLETRKSSMSRKDMQLTNREIEIRMKAIRDFNPVQSSYGLDEETRKAVNLILQ